MSTDPRRDLRTLRDDAEPWAIVLAGGEGVRLRILTRDLHARLVGAAGFFGSRRERWAARQAYQSAPAHNFSRAILERHPQVAVSKLPHLVWSDLGTPARLLRLLRALRLRPPWLRTGAARLSRLATGA